MRTARAFTPVQRVQGRGAGCGEPQAHLAGKKAGNINLNIVATRAPVLEE